MKKYGKRLCAIIACMIIVGLLSYDSIADPVVTAEKSQAEFLNEFFGEDAVARAREHELFWPLLEGSVEIYGREKFSSLIDGLAAIFETSRKALFFSFIDDPSRFYYFVKSLDLAFVLHDDISSLGSAINYLGTVWGAGPNELRRAYFHQPYKLIFAAGCVRSFNSRNGGMYGSVLGGVGGCLDREKLKRAFLEEPADVALIIIEISRFSRMFFQELVGAIGADNFIGAFLHRPGLLLDNLRLLGASGPEHAAEILRSIIEGRDEYSVLFSRKEAAGDAVIEETKRRLTGNYFENWDLPGKNRKLKEMILRVLSIYQKSIFSLSEEEYGSLVAHILLSARFVGNYASANSDFMIGTDYFMGKSRGGKIDILAHEIAHHFLEPSVSSGAIGEFTADMGSFGVLRHLGFKETIGEIQREWSGRFSLKAKERNPKITEEHEAARVQMLWIARLLEGNIKWDKYFAKAVSIARADKKIIFYEFIARSLVSYLEETGDPRHSRALFPDFSGKQNRMVTPEELRDIISGLDRD